MLLQRAKKLLHRYRERKPYMLCAGIVDRNFIPPYQSPKWPLKQLDCHSHTIKIVKTRFTVRVKVICKGASISTITNRMAWLPSQIRCEHAEKVNFSLQ